MILHPSTYEIIIIVIFVALAISASALIAYTSGRLTGAEQILYEQLIDVEKQLREYEALLEKYKQCKVELCTKCRKKSCTDCPWED